jgi:bacterioferritin-associated ferredoxin
VIFIGITLLHPQGFLIDNNAPLGYKPSTLFSSSGESLFCSVIERKMDREFLGLIDRVDELLATPTEKLEDDVLICECFCVSAGDIRRIMGDDQYLDLARLQKDLSLGQGCQGCLKSAENWFKKIF